MTSPLMTKEHPNIMQNGCVQILVVTDTESVLKDMEKQFTVFSLNILTPSPMTIIIILLACKQVNFN